MPERATSPRSPAACPAWSRAASCSTRSGVAKGRIPAEKMAEVLAENPAKLYGAFPRKGILVAGSDADIVVIDPTKTGLITASGPDRERRLYPVRGLPHAGRHRAGLSARPARRRPRRGSDRQDRAIYPARREFAVIQKEHQTRRLFYRRERSKNRFLRKRET